MLLDTATLYFRAFFAIPDSLRAPDGTPVNALRGVLDFISALSTSYRPDAIVACWDDDWRPSWRVELLSSYKTHRVVTEASGNQIEETPDALNQQVPLIAQALELLGIPVVGAPEAEADDVIGTLVHQWSGPVDVVTGDRDLFQVVDDSRATRVLYTARGVRKHDIVDQAWVEVKYGIKPEQYVDFAVLRGDPSDGLPGVPGIGDKTAGVLLNTFNDLNSILDAAQASDAGIKPKVRDALVASREYATNAQKVVTVRPDLRLDRPQVLAELSAEDIRAFVGFGEQWGLGGVVERALAARHVR